MDQFDSDLSGVRFKAQPIDYHEYRRKIKLKDHFESLAQTTQDWTRDLNVVMQDMWAVSTIGGYKVSLQEALAAEKVIHDVLSLFRELQEERESQTKHLAQILEVLEFGLAARKAVHGGELHKGQDASPKQTAQTVLPMTTAPPTYSSPDDHQGSRYALKVQDYLQKFGKGLVPQHVFQGGNPFELARGIFNLGGKSATSPEKTEEHHERSKEEVVAQAREAPAAQHAGQSPSSNANADDVAIYGSYERDSYVG